MQTWNGQNAKVDAQLIDNWVGNPPVAGDMVNIQTQRGPKQVVIVYVIYAGFSKRKNYNVAYVITQDPQRQQQGQGQQQYNQPQGGQPQGGQPQGQPNYGNPQGGQPQGQYPQGGNPQGQYPQGGNPQGGPGAGW